jgi:hypothetical protein
MTSSQGWEEEIHYALPLLDPCMHKLLWAYFKICHH